MSTHDLCSKHIYPNKAPLADAIWAVARGGETPVLCEDESASITCSRRELTSSETTVTEGDAIQRLVSVIR